MMRTVNSQLCFEDLLLNPSVHSEDEGRLSRQAKGILELFLEGRQKGRLVSTAELADIGLQYSARVHEVRRYLVPRGFCVDLLKRGPGGMNWYAMVPLAESNFYKTHPELHYL